MTSARRFLIAACTAGLLLLPEGAFAQAAPSAATNTPATDTVGPAELQNFSLKGTVTRPADQPPAPTPARPQTAPVRAPALAPVPSRPAGRKMADRNLPAATISQAQKLTPPPAPAPQPTLQAEVRRAPALAPTIGPPSTAPAGIEPVQADRGFPLWPWVAAIGALILGGGFLLFRRWPRPVAAEGPQFDLLAPRPAEPRPKPQEAARPPATAPSPAPVPERRNPLAGGIVASRLRPTLELGFQPLRCQVDDQHVAIEFELELFNAGAAPARAVLAEASLLNAGATQDRELSAFFANPNGIGDRLEMIPPMQRVSFKSQVVAPRAAVHEYELAGRKAFVPVVAFNALYEWSGGKAQSSAAYLVGRDTQRDKLGPLRLEQGAREYRGLGARLLPSVVRT